MDKIIIWATEFIKNKDLVKKEITQIHEKDTYVDITKKESSEIIVTNQEYLDKSSNFLADKVWVVFEMKKDVPKAITENWDFFTKPHIWLIIVNTKTHAKWLLHPIAHNKIIDSNNLEKSLTILQKNA